MRPVTIHIELTSDELVQLIGFCAVVDVLGCDRIKVINKKIEQHLSDAIQLSDFEEINKSFENYRYD